MSTPLVVRCWRRYMQLGWCINFMTCHGYGRHYLIIVDHFSKFAVVKHSQDLTSKTTTINLLLEVFSEHGITSTIRCDHGHNFISSQFIEFCKQLNIADTLSSGYHHSSNPAEQAVETVKSLMKRCLAANASWCIALLKHLSTLLGANIPSPSELIGRQFRGLLPFNTVALLRVSKNKF